MRKFTLKLTSIFLLAALLLPLLCSSAFAALDDGSESSVKVETGIYKEIEGTWTRVDTVCGGDNVKARVFITTDFTSKGADLTLFYDNSFFSDSYTVESHSLAFNAEHSLVAAQGLEGDFTKTGSVAKESFPLLNLVGSDFYDAHNYFMVSITPTAVPFFKYDGSDWLFEFDLTVRSDAQGEGDIFVSSDTLCHSGQPEFHGLNFVKGSVSGPQAAMPSWLSVFSVEPQVQLVSNPVSRLADLSVETELFIFNPDSNNWTATDCVAPGDRVKARVYLDTTYPVLGGQFVLFYDNAFFSDSIGDGIVDIGKNGTRFNTVSGTDSSDTGVTGTVCTGASGSKTVSQMVEHDLLDQRVADENNFILVTLLFNYGVESRLLNSAGGTEWFVEIDLTVLADATGMGDVFSLTETFCSPDSPAYGYGDFHKHPVGSSSPFNAFSMSYWQAYILVKSNPVYVSGEARDITLSASEITVDAGFSQPLGAEVLPETAVNKNVVWESADTAIATVDDDGVVTGVAAGRTTITARPAVNPNSVSATCAVTVNAPVTSIALTPETASINVSASQSLSASVLPVDTGLGELTWTSSRPDIATVDNAGVVTGVAPGETIITACPAYNPHNISATCTVTVIRPAQGVNVTFTGGNVGVGSTCALTVTFIPGDTSNKAVRWSSSNPGVATVDENGVVTGVAPGTAVITVTTADSSFSDSCEITVERAATGVSVTFTGGKIDVGSTCALTLAFTPADASGPQVKWSSSNPSVATVDENGVVTAVAPGTAVITVATANGSFSDSCEITVSRPAQGVNITLSSQGVKTGESAALAIIFIPADTSNKTVQWSSSNPGVATVDESGVVTGVAPGTAVITVTTNDGSFSDSCTITVEAAAQAVSTVTISLTQATIRYKKGDLSLTAIADPASAITWSSADPKIASVSQNGVVTARDMGTTDIIATAADGTSARCRVTVTMTFWQRIVRWFKILFGTWNTAMAFIY